MQEIKGKKQEAAGGDAATDSLHGTAALPMQSGCRGVRLGIFGGAFDPPHLGHAAAADFFAAALQLDRLLILPAGESPLKAAGSAAAADRLALCRRTFTWHGTGSDEWDAQNAADAFVGHGTGPDEWDAQNAADAFVGHGTKPDEWDTQNAAETLIGHGANSGEASNILCEISDWELRRPGTSYTIDTLRAVRAANADAALFLLIGSDQVRQFTRWRAWQEILQLCQVCALQRDGEAIETELPIRLLKGFVPIDIHSTRLRSAIAGGEDVSSWLAPAAYAYIKEKGLYRVAT